ncbi:hypothetical protein GOP47_0022814 [Adiantum capillus-veneris]|uniref:Uncharacterized protein n=1 Tax=Adiantum capillus-veneris TaxID=13818 RepID=A0A9D4Z5W0_ADICA|nr:hypothetical protein GOP47_0022814 [Adiantum capillus-veneris]
MWSARDILASQLCSSIPRLWSCAATAWRCCASRQEAVLDSLKAAPSGRRVIKGASYLPIPHLHQGSLFGDVATPASGSWEWMTLPVGAPSSVTVEDQRPLRGSKLQLDSVAAWH